MKPLWAGLLYILSLDCLRTSKPSQIASLMKPTIFTKETTYATRNEDTGLIEVRDKVSDNILAIYEHASQLDQVESLVPFRHPDGDLIYVTPGIIAEKLRRYTRYVYTPQLGDLIADLIVEGNELSKIHTLYSFVPKYSIIWRWMKQFPEFKQKIEDAYEARAELTRDRISSLAKEAESIDKEDVPGVKLAIDTKKWLAEKDGPKKYSGKTKIEADIRAQVLTIDTGIRRPGDEGYNKDHTREIVDSMVQLTPGEVGNKDVNDPG